MILLLLAAAASTEPAVDCADPMTQTDMNICAYRDYQAADVALNEQWKKTADNLKAMDAAIDLEDGRPSYFDQLLAGQRAWLKYRDEHCRSEGYLARGGSMEPLLVSTCRTELTKRRTEELRALMDWGN